SLFEPLTRLKFDLPCAESSGAWIGSRLHFREGASPFGYIPGHNWTQVLCHRLTRALLDRGITVRTRASVAEISYDDDRVRSVTLEDGQTLSADEFIFTIPTETTTRLLPEDRTRTLRSIRYTAILSAIVTTRQPISPRFYWLNLLERRQASTGIFMLDALNPTIGRRDDISLNFTTHLSGRDHPMYALSDEELLQRYSNDFEELFGAPLVTDWSRLVRVPMYSPIFHRDYRNPPIRSETYRNVWFAGNYLTHPSIASTGTALLSGVRTAEALIGDDREASPLSAAIVRFRLRGMKRA
ncbi:MAG: FAD-dependent oxidoreductase, partial [Acidobacteriota bacterium]|nr:FAD-dependent oxidoreductase [Acidobacteriota bacterium]